MPCVQIPNGCLCLAGPTISIVVDGKEYLFEIHRYHGPLPLNKDGSCRQSDWPRKVWDAVQDWIDRGEPVDDEGRCQ